MFTIQAFENLQLILRGPFGRVSSVTTTGTHVALEILILLLDMHERLLALIHCYRLNVALAVSQASRPSLFLDILLQLFGFL